jgi:thiol-disulfide isomerase/thioredoxin
MTRATSWLGEKKMPSLRGAVDWLNSKPLDAGDFRGKVVLIDFWTFTCINWRRTLPYLRGWQAKYQESGLVVIGIHTPEFSFEHDVPSVQRQARAMKIDYPIAIDNNYSIWQEFDNQYRPALYLIDAQGLIGVLDFVIAFATGFAFNTPTVYPLVLVPGFLVPLALGFHLHSLRKPYRGTLLGSK